MDGFQLFITSLEISLAGCILILFLPVNRKAPAAIFIVIINALLTSIPALNALLGGGFTIAPGSISFGGDISIRLDALSAWFIIIINITSIMGALYGIGYMKAYREQKQKIALHWISFVIFQLSMIWVCIVQNCLLFLVVWELMSISSFLLVIFDHENQRTLKAGLNYLVQMHIGVILLTIAFIWVYFSVGSLEFDSFKEFFAKKPNIWLFLLLFGGFGLKAGFVPLHSWLPHAHPAAPSHVSGVMSGVIVKMGIYGIFRSISFLQHDQILIGEIILSLSLLTGLFGIINSAVNRDFKRMLAYCTIENIGIIGSGIGMGLIGLGSSQPWLVVLGFGGALLHTLNHSLFKSLLFFSAGSVYQQTHTRDMEKLGGLLRKMPHTAFFFLIGALAIGGMPPFNGFVSEFIIYSGFIKGLESANFLVVMLMVSSLAGLAVIGGISIYTFTKSFGVIFLGNPRTHLHTEPVEVSLLMRLPQYLIVIIMLAIGLFPVWFFKATAPVISLLSPTANTGFSSMGVAFPKTLTSIGFYSILFTFVCIGTFWIRSVMAGKQAFSISPTWSCGYIAPKASMQYTGKSFSKTLGKLLSSVVIERKKYKELNESEVFPDERNHSAFYSDFFEFRIFDKLIPRMLAFMNYFQFIQNGSLQRYIVYGLFFILIVFLGSVFSLL